MEQGPIFYQVKYPSDEGLIPVHKSIFDILMQIAYRNLHADQIISNLHANQVENFREDPAGIRETLYMDGGFYGYRKQTTAE